MTTLFISDLHLDPKRPNIVRAFLSFLQDEAQQADALYILGDFFEAWIGDDEDDPFYPPILNALKTLTSDSTPCYIMRGNRDFLIGQDFCQQTGCQLLDDPCLIDLYGKPVLLMHGDSLCTRDEGYMNLRAQIRNGQWQKDFLSKSLNERRAIAQQLRNASKEASQYKASDIMDVTPEEVTNIMAEYDVGLLIHGHTHRPAIHSLDDDKKRIVLGDWYTEGWMLRYSNNGDYQLEQFSI
jgi:UDP-2,3-diacylglucosamine hydrolase